MAALAEAFAVNRKGDRFGAMLTNRAEVSAARRVTRIRLALARHLTDSLSGIAATADDRGVTIEGRGLFRRALTDMRLRWPGSFLK
jgi:hypothetical protein